jgi:hypothetical protein
MTLRGQSREGFWPFSTLTSDAEDTEGASFASEILQTSSADMAQAIRTLYKESYNEPGYATYDMNPKSVHDFSTPLVLIRGHDFTYSRDSIMGRVSRKRI